MDKLNSEKEVFEKNIIPKWIKEAKEREKTYDITTKN